jgi:serine/threonine protein kinase
VDDEVLGDADGFRVEFAAGSRLAGYRLEEEIGRGGMAVVFRARDERLGRLVALKILAPALATDKSFQQRFIRESRAAAAVDDPHIVPVYEAGESDGVLFIAMRYVRGGDARSLLRDEGPLPPGRVATIISPVASALDAAHAEGLLHRDVKPGNMLVDVVPGRPEHVYLSDFGLSKTRVSSANLTAMGHFLGTLAYVAPEQIGGKATDGRADQYALACSAFELLTGETPFSDDDATALMYAHTTEPPPTLTSLRSSLPAEADKVLARALAKAPEDRYPTCREFADALRGAFGLQPYDSGPEAIPGSHPRTEKAVTPTDTPDFSRLNTRDAQIPPPQHGSGSGGSGPDGQGGQVPPPARGGRRRTRIIVAAAAAVVVLAAAGVVVALASGGGPARPTSFTIATKSALAPVSGHVYVLYKYGSQASARITGKIKGVTSGMVAQLYAQQFPYHRAAAPVGSAILHPVGKTATYSFTVTPTLATRYQVELFPSSTATTPLATSPASTVYVALIALSAEAKTCKRPVCRESLPSHVAVPASALSTEMAKTWYPYFKLNLAPVKEPPSPKTLLLGAGNPHVTASRRVSATEFDLTVTFSFRIGNKAYYWNWTMCSKDTEAKDGIGLPGAHDCGAKSVQASQAYLG